MFSNDLISTYFNCARIKDSIIRLVLGPRMAVSLGHALHVGRVPVSRLPTCSGSTALPFHRPSPVSARSLGNTRVQKAFDCSVAPITRAMAGAIDTTMFRNSVRVLGFATKSLAVKDEFISGGLGSCSAR